MKGTLLVTSELTIKNAPEKHYLLKWYNCRVNFPLTDTLVSVQHYLQSLLSIPSFTFKSNSIFTYTFLAWISAASSASRRGRRLKFRLTPSHKGALSRRRTQKMKIKFIFVPDRSQPPYLRTWKKKRAKRLRSTGRWGLGFVSGASKKNKEAVDISDKKWLLSPVIALLLIALPLDQLTNRTNKIWAVNSLFNWLQVSLSKQQQQHVLVFSRSRMSSVPSLSKETFNRILF